jgi:redox-sensitive bicupin YhaK (pirin superfamily)
MLTIRRDKEIHREEGGWFSARWHFSFDHYRDPANDGFGAMRVTLGSGALHSEQNASQDEPMRFIQIWVLPDTPGLQPEVEQRVFTKQDRSGRLLRVMGPEGGQVVRIHQDASVHVASLAPGERVEHPIGPGRGAYVYLIDGRARFDDEPVATGDAAKVTGQPSLRIAADAPSELILVDVPMRFRPVGIWAGQGA